MFVTIIQGFHLRMYHAKHSAFLRNKNSILKLFFQLKDSQIIILVLYVILFINFIKGLFLLLDTQADFGIILNISYAVSHYSRIVFKLIFIGFFYVATR